MADHASLDLAPGVRVVWDDLDEVRASLAAEEPVANWRFEGELGSGYSALRVLSGATEKGTLLLLSSLRPHDADGHDAENPQALIVKRSGEVTGFEEALVSTQYAASGAIERVGLEFYAEGDDYPLRGAGDVRGLSASDEGSVRRERAALDFRLDGEPGAAVLEILHA